jgi:hypothetical protein
VHVGGRPSSLASPWLPGWPGGRVTIIIATVTLGAGQRVFEDLVNLWSSGTSECASRLWRVSSATA